MRKKNRNKNEIMHEVLYLLIRRGPQLQSSICLKVDIIYYNFREIISKLMELGYIRTHNIHRTQYIITIKGIDYLLQKNICVLKHVHRLRIYDDMGGIKVEYFFTTKKKAEIRLNQCKHEMQTKITTPYYDIKEIEIE